MVLIHRLNVSLKPLFLAHKKNIIMYFQMGFQLDQSHRLTVTGLKMAKSPNIVSL